MNRPLFVYGTLRDPDILGLVLAHPVVADSVALAIAPGHRVVFFPHRTYPAIRAEADTTAEGALLSGLSAADMALLDLFEGAEYSRQAIEIIVNGAARQADVYWPAQAIPADAADWRLADWVLRHKAAFLGAEARSIEELRRRLTALPGDAATPQEEF